MGTMEPKEFLLPSELWKMVLAYVRDMDYSQMSQCRLVSKNWKTLSDEVLKENASLWTSTFEDWPTFLKRVKGTRFSSAEKVDQFIAEMKGHEGNPFPNGTVILLTSEGNEDMLESLRKLVNCFRHQIISLVYSFNGNDEEEILQILRIGKLKNLEHLAIYKPAWSTLSSNGLKVIRELSELSSSQQIRGPKNLTELQMFGTASVLPIAQIFPIFKNFVKSVAKLQFSRGLSRRHLRYLDPLGISSYFDLIKSNFCKYDKGASFSSLKFIHPCLGLEFLPEGQRSNENNNEMRMARRFQELSIRVENYPNFNIHKPLGQKISQDVFALLDGCQATEDLKLLNMDIDREIIINSTAAQLQLDPPVNVDVKYRNLTHLIVNLSTILLWDELVNGLIPKIENLKKLTLNMNASDHEGKTPKEFHDDVCTKLWNKFPSGMETMCVPYFGWVLKRGNLRSFLDLKF